MAELSVNGFDIGVGVVLIVSAAYAAYRGLMRETLSVLAPAVAAYVSLLLYPSAEPILRQHIESDWMASAVAIVGVFLCMWLPLAFMTHSFSQKVQNTSLGPVDQILGFIFGLGRGLVIVGIAYIAFSYFVPVSDQPAAVKEAKSLPVIRDTSMVLLTLVPDNTALRSGASRALAEPGDENSSKKKPENKDSSASQQSYGANDRRALDRLIETTGGN